MKAALLGAVYLRAGDIARQQVGGELDAVEVALNAVGQALDGAGLGKTGRALHQQVAVSQQGRQQPLDQVFLPDYLLFQPLFESGNLFSAHAFESPLLWVRGSVTE